MQTLRLTILVPAVWLIASYHDMLGIRLAAARYTVTLSIGIGSWVHGPRDFGSGFKAGGVKPGRDQTSYRYKLSVRVFGCGFKSGWAFGAGARGAESWFESDLIPAGGLMHPGFRLGRTECFIGNTLIKYYNRADVTIDGEAHKYRPE